MEKTDYQKVYEEQVEAWKLYKSRIYDKPLLDGDGYPTEHCFEVIRAWHWSDAEDCFQFIRNFWQFSNYWREDYVDEDEYNKVKFDKPRHRYYISTAGWSGNESLIRALQENQMLWNLNWVQSRRGGHYIFELRV